MEPNITAPKIIQRLSAALIAYFDFNGSSTCNQLRDYLSTFVRALGEDLDNEVIYKSANKVDGKSFEDWKSIYINEATQLQSHAIGTFAHHVADLAAFPLSASQKVPCETGYTYIAEFRDCWRKARAQLAEMHSIEPMSQKHQRKRAGHSWIPYLADTFER